MKEPYRIKTAVSPEPMTLEEVKEYFDRLAQRRAVNPERENPRIMKR